MGNRVREIRRSNDETQAELAKAVGTTRQTIIAIEKGRTPMPGLMFKIANHFQKPVHEVFVDVESEQAATTA